MTNLLAVVWLGWLTNTVSPDVRDDSLRRNGYTWLATNIVSVVIGIPVTGVGNVTNVVPVFTNITKFTIIQSDENMRILSNEEAEKRGLPFLTNMPPVPASRTNKIGCGSK